MQMLLDNHNGLSRREIGRRLRSWSMRPLLSIPCRSRPPAAGRWSFVRHRPSSVRSLARPNIRRLVLAFAWIAVEAGTTIAEQIKAPPRILLLKGDPSWER